MRVKGKRGRPKVAHIPEDLQAELRKMYHPVWEKASGGWVVKGQSIGAVNELTALLRAFRVTEDPIEREYLFWEIANSLWNKDPDDKRFARHKWSYEVIHALCHEKYLAVGGSASSGKSYTCAGWAIVNWLCDPANTIVLMTSTDIKGSMKRIFGAVMRLIEKVPDPPCKIVESLGIIKYYDGKTAHQTAGLQIVTADKNSDRVGKLVGIKANRVFLIADELGELTDNIRQAALGNLAKNPYFQFVGLSNPASRFDPFGIFAVPKNGWDSVNVETDDTWRMANGGLYIRLDAERSPNIDQSPSPLWETGVFYPYLPSQDSLDADLEALGATPEEARVSRGYMRFNRAIFFDSEDSDTVYSESHFMRNRATEKVSVLNPTLVAGCDPSFSAGGDKTVVVLVEEGFDNYGQHIVQYKDMAVLHVDATDKANPFSLQLAEKIRGVCKKWNVSPENFAIDATGAGGMVADMLSLQWGTNIFLRVQFGGAASDKRIKNDSRTVGKDRYVNRATELHMIGLQFLTGHQLKNVPPVIIEQLCKRKLLDPVKGPNGPRFQIEPKKNFRQRIGKSPDEADAFLVAIECARERRLFVPLDPPQGSEKKNIATWLQNRRTHASFAADRLGHVANL